MAPRGIVAVSVASLFAIELGGAGFPEAEQLVNMTFTVVVGTVMVYSLIARPLAKSLDLTQNSRRARSLSARIIGRGRSRRPFKRRASRSGWSTRTAAISKTPEAGLEAFNESIMADGILDDLPLESVGPYFGPDRQQ